MDLLERVDGVETLQHREQRPTSRGLPGPRRLPVDEQHPPDALQLAGSGQPSEARADDHSVAVVHRGVHVRAPPLLTAAVPATGSGHAQHRVIYPTGVYTEYGSNPVATTSK